MNLGKKLALGTAQFGSNYGIANARGRIPPEEISEILRYAVQKGIRTLDTAHAYGESELVLGKFLGEQPALFRVITKLPQLEGEKTETQIAKVIEESLGRLNARKIYGYLIHHFQDFMKRPEIWNTLQAFKKKRIIAKIGFSLYHVDELEELFRRGVVFDMLQVPYSIFDRRFEKQFSLLKEKSVEIHVRSIFLQGLAFLSPDQLPQPVRKAKDTLQTLRKIAEKEEIAINAMCLNFVLLNPSVDQVVIGIDSLQQLKNNVEDVRFFQKVRALKDVLKPLAIEDEDVILPYRWSRG